MRVCETIMQKVKNQAKCSRRASKTRHFLEFDFEELGGCWLKSRAYRRDGRHYLAVFPQTVRMLQSDVSF